jgi:hypothetical protein
VVTWKAFGPQAGLEVHVCKRLGISATLKSGFKMEIPADTRRAVRSVFTSSH